jgi:glycosyltransferase involved in cell wall biosynthesis
MHVLHVIDGLGLGGAERMLVDIANRTVADGHRVSVCVTRSNVTLAPQLDPRIELLVLERRRRIDPAAYLRFVTWMRAQHIDVIHAHLRSNLAFVLPMKVLRLARAPIVFHDHYGTIEVDTSTPRWFRVGHRYLSMYVGVYEKLAEWARAAGMPAERTRAIPNALDLDRLVRVTPSNLRGELGIQPSMPLGVMVATLRRDKAIEVLLDAVAQARSRDRICIAIAGHDGEPAYAERMRARCRELGLADTVRFLGPRTDVPALLASADFALLSSHTESGPLVLIEYIAARLPFVSTLVGDIGRRLHGMGVPGFVKPTDPAELAEGLDALIALTPEQRRARGELGHAKLVEGWDIRAAMPAWYEVYRTAIAR